MVLQTGIIDEDWSVETSYIRVGALATAIVLLVLRANVVVSTRLYSGVFWLDKPAIECYTVDIKPMRESSLIKKLPSFHDEKTQQRAFTIEISLGT